MASSETSCKVNFVGIWNENTFTDEVMKTISAYAQVEKGKKVKLILGKDGIRITKSKVFHQNLIEFYPYERMKTVSRNPCFGNCIMFIMDGREKKYRIIAIRCPSDSNSIYIVNRVSQLRDSIRSGNVEFKKQDNGNWTLRERSAHNANRHLREIFNEQEEGTNGDATKLNGDVHHVPVLDKSKEQSRSSTYIKRNDTVVREGVVVDNGEDAPIEIHALRDEGVRDSNDLQDFMDHVKVADTLHRRSTLPSKQMVSTVATTSTSADGPLHLRATSSRTYEARVHDPYYYNNNNNNQWASHRRFSGDFILPAQMDRRFSTADSMRSGSSTRVQFDNLSLMSVPRNTTSMRIRPVTGTPGRFTMNTTVQRAIEDTYARPVIIQHHHSSRRTPARHAHQISRSQRPTTVHVIGGNDLRIYEPYDDSDMPL